MISISKKNIKVITYFLLCDMLIGIFVPSIGSLYALTSGPSSPEFSSFEPVATTNLVDPLSGNFTYNLPVIQIPGPDGGGYAMSLSYHSGTSSEEEASWVGHGWTLNPGAINTSVRGYPDDYNNVPVDVYNKTRPSWTMTGSGKANLEVFSQSKKNDDGSRSEQFSLSAGLNVRYNNYQGVSRTTSIGLSKGFGSLSLNRSPTGVTFSAAINPFALLKTGVPDLSYEKAKIKSRTKKNGKQVRDKSGVAAGVRGGGSLNLGSTFGLQSFTDVGQSVSLTKLNGINVNLSYGGQVNLAVAPVGIEGGVYGTFSLNHSAARRTLNASGYLNSSVNARSDYFTEKSQPFDRRDFFIGIPFSSPDNHMLSGEGLSGGFRAFADGPRAYANNDDTKNNIKTYGVGLEGMVGTNIGVGVNLSFGKSTSEMRSRANLGGGSHSDIKYRFYGDKGGKVNFANNDVAYVELGANPDFPGIKQVSTAVKDEGKAFFDASLKSDQNTSSHIEKLSSGGFEIYNESGIKYEYSQPVMIKNTANLSFDVDDKDTVEKNYLAYTETYLKDNYEVEVCAQERVTGEVRRMPYENTSLLKVITTPDYIDLGQAGPDDSDFGGWTSFEYHKKYGEASEEGKWYRWRIPYNGLYYSKNSISDVKDDTGYVSTGEKEVFYLKKVETKTHVAYFVTNKSNAARFGVSGDGSSYLSGSQESRLDGLAAEDLSATIDPASESARSKGTDELEYLEKIVLFSKARMDVPLQVTNFQYDYSLIQNLPNNVNGNYPNNKVSANSGKLTLKKVWSEFEGVVDARISSYKFGYQYTANHQMSTQYSLSAQNPDYGPHVLDAWGYNQFNVKGNTNSAENRHLNLITWPYQGDISPRLFDPAAWQLKQIVLPSGGEILVEYESKDYLYVQDRDAMAMVSLTSASNSYDDPTYTLDLSDIGGYSDGLCEKVNEYFLEGRANGGGDDDVRKRIYFKLLYALENNRADLLGCKSEYITGYAKVKNITCNGSSISITLKGRTNGHYIGEGFTENHIEDNNYRLTPRQACYDYYITQRWGKYTAGCEGAFERKYEAAINNDLLNCGDIGSTSLGKALDALEYAQDGIEGLADRRINTSFPRKNEVCMSLNPQLSYLKIPINKAKRGGGVRVKKLLMYDKGIESGDSATYGQIYRYELEDGRSSGVATNEPQEMREENPLVGFLPKKDQSWINRLVAGKDKEQSEGPIGESLLPSATVGHSRVVVENIHTGKTGTGYTVHEFFTCKDYPYDKLYDYSIYKNGDRQFDFADVRPERGVSFSVLQDNLHDDRLNLPTPYFTYGFDKAWASQGFRFIQNSMHGAPKSVRTYGGTYVPGSTSYISSGQDFYYYEPGEKVKLFTEFDGESAGKYIWDVPGKEMDITQEGYRIDNKDLDFEFEIDVSVGLTLPPPIFVSFGLVFRYKEQLLTKYATSKVIKYPVIQKKTVTYTDNIASTTENLAFDYGTGRPVLTKTYDAFHGIELANSDQVHDGSIYNLNLPAHWNYSGMGQKSDLTNNTNQLLASSGQIVTYGSNANPIDRDGNWTIKTDKIISAGANTYNTLAGVTEWVNNQSVNSVYGSLGNSSVFRMHESYAFKGDVKKSSDRNTDNGKIYEGGIVENFTPFNYKSDVQDQQWVKLNEVTKYSPNGVSLEERDVLGVPSAAKYGYNFTLPTMIAKNATYDEVYFEHFEDKVGTITGLVNNTAHSGIYSKQIISGESLIKNVVARELLTTTGGWLKFWTKSNEDLMNPQVDVNGNVFTPEFMAKTGEWTLYRVFITPQAFVSGQEVLATLSFENPEAYLDDVKFNPKEAQTTSYVYDVKSLRLLTLFDDQHFGLFYQYNGEGQLVRKLIETEKGLKIITETQYNLPKESRERI
ncbi:hypothetical protein U6A24_11270 [Aquimarina gracilis]|uniref:YD repeat-containing protein n=1 Tax=Aquimarina gracilis TaxID=874422 RepID=A0ABU5ZVY2_9FLAO|nr:hypothetical protein [Aquimarina gracilis]MEB3346046.1 hypothetical protein [Aquimarina gracilis]